MLMDGSEDTSRLFHKEQSDAIQDHVLKTVVTWTAQFILAAPLGDFHWWTKLKQGHNSFITFSS